VRSAADLLSVPDHMRKPPKLRPAGADLFDAIEGD
jgi:hypothetical protein